MKTIHNDAEDFICYNCDKRSKSFGQNNNLQANMKNFHEGENNQCDKCSKSLSHSGNPSYFQNQFTMEREIFDVRYAP